jgi:hypothetical protein
MDDDLALANAISVRAEELKTSGSAMARAGRRSRLYGFVWYGQRDIIRWSEG